jgi:hypothetical protein
VAVLVVAVQAGESVAAVASTAGCGCVVAAVLLLAAIPRRQRIV